jgi:hypothetical protein
MNRMSAFPRCAVRPMALGCIAVGVNRRGVLIVVRPEIPTTTLLYFNMWPDFDLRS